LYGGCPEEDCAKLFEFTLDSIINYLKYEQIYGYKICSKCEKLKERNDIEFEIRGHQKSTNVCTKCRKIKDKQYVQDNYKCIQRKKKLHYLKNKEKIKLYREENKEKMKLYREENKEKLQEYMKKYQEENKEIRKEYSKKYYLKNKEKIKKAAKKSFLNNKEKIKEYMKFYREENKKSTKEYMKEYRNSPASEKLLQQLELYEEVKGNQIKCRYCGDWYTPTNQEVYNRLKGILKSDIRFIYCSEKCKTACPTYNKSLHPEIFKPASSREVNPILRQLVFERDQYTCQKCFTHKDKLNCPLHCHHITPYVDSPIEGNDPENCITLCKDCHKEVHQIPGCGYNELRCG
jgi:hypothetical protein